jgi:hypothetical protein
MTSKQEILITKARYAANPLDYKKLILERSFQKDWNSKSPIVIYPRLRQIAASANRR